MGFFDLGFLKRLAPTRGRFQASDCNGDFDSMRLSDLHGLYPAAAISISGKTVTDATELILIRGTGKFAARIQTRRILRAIVTTDQPSGR
jgi:hypothetical protein